MHYNYNSQQVAVHGSSRQTLRAAQSYRAPRRSRRARRALGAQIHVGSLPGRQRTRLRRRRAEGAAAEPRSPPPALASTGGGALQMIDANAVLARVQGANLRPATPAARACGRLL